MYKSIHVQIYKISMINLSHYCPCKIYYTNISYSFEFNVIVRFDIQPTNQTDKTNWRQFSFSLAVGLVDMWGQTNMVSSVETKPKGSRFGFKVEACAQNQTGSVVGFSLVVGSVDMLGKTNMVGSVETCAQNRTNPTYEHS